MWSCAGLFHELHVPVPTLDIASIAQLLRDVCPAEMSFGEGEGDESGFLFWGPITAGEARIQAPEPTLGTLGATPTTADKSSDLDP